VGPAEIVAITTWPAATAAAPPPVVQTLYRIRLLDGSLRGIMATVTPEALCPSDEEGRPATPALR
jgi:hypothetical protein